MTLQFTRNKLTRKIGYNSWKLVTEGDKDNDDDNDADGDDDDDDDSDDDDDDDPVWQAHIDYIALMLNVLSILTACTISLCW